ncbi:MAG: Flp pilus assembly complex ATPase component TadA [Deltaproteobacteria bacterium]|nr:Flp pilus assembly complex ATPase component TadA [Deltaproteobacteria bacterium]
MTTGLSRRKSAPPGGGAFPSLPGEPENGRVIDLPESWGRQLVAQGLVREQQWQEALARHKGDHNAALRSLVNSRQAEREKLMQGLAQATGLELISGSYLAKSGKPLENLPYRFLKYHRVVPVEIRGEELLVAVSEPVTGEVLRALEQFTGLQVRPCLAMEEEILRKIEVHYGLGRRGAGSIEGADDEMDTSGRLAVLEDMSSDAPAIRLFNYFVDRAVDIGASDIHVEAQENDLRVRYRVDGVLHDQESLSKKMQAPIISRIKIMAKLNIAERRLAQDGKIVMSVGGHELDLRVSTLPTVHGESVVIRLLYRDSLGAELTGVGMGPDHLAQMMELIQRPHGLMLVTGPTGSGKTTTLYAALQLINSPNKKIITIEDPVEYRLAGINQMQVNPQIGLTFASGLRSIVRQDPDVILVGEIRDRETADIAIHAALTGHLVFSTLHTNEAAGAMTRLQDMGVDSFLISSALTAVLAQRLVRVLCDHCKATDVYRGDHGIDLARQGDQVWRGQGCPECTQLGYRGRTGIFELITISETMRGLINQRVDSETLRRQALKEGMRTLRQDGWLKVSEGVTSLEELLRVTSW